MRAAILVLAIGVGACGPMVQPMVPRLDPESQQQVDQMWENMLTPSQRLDRMLLLDVVLEYQIYQMGINRLHLTSEKQVKGGVVIMEVHFDRERPATDEFTIRYVDTSGNELRRERYSRREVEDRMQFLWNVEVTTRPGEDGQTCIEYQEADRAAYEARLKKIEAATRPADSP